MPRFDLNGDGRVDMQDMAIWQRLAGDVTLAIQDAMEAQGPPDEPDPPVDPPVEPPADTMDVAHRTVAKVAGDGAALFVLDGTRAGVTWDQSPDWLIDGNGVSGQSDRGMIAAFIAGPGTYTIRMGGKQQTVRVEGVSGPVVTVDTGTALASAIAGAQPGTVVRLLSGREYVLSSPLVVSRPGPVLVETAGSTRAVVRWTTGDGIILNRASGWTFRNLDLIGPGASQLQSRAVETVESESDILFDLVAFRRWGDYGAAIGNPQLPESKVPRGIGIVRCTFQDNAGRGLWLECRESWLGGCLFAKEDALRIGWASRSVVSNCTIEGQSSSTDANWRIHGQNGRSGSRYVTFAGLDVSGKASGDWSGEIAPTNTDATNGADDIQVIGSRFAASIRTQVLLRLCGSRIMVDDCDFDATNAAKIYGPGWADCIVVNRGGTNTNPTDVLIRNCRAVRTDSANNCYLLKIDPNVTGIVRQTGNSVDAPLCGAKGVVNPGGRQPN